jgi:NADPH:quinone reductase
MKAILCRAFASPPQLALEDVPPPRPGPGELLIDVRASGVNFPDFLMVEGKYQRLPPLPFVPGMELAGTVAGVGDDVAGFAVGDRVLATPGQGGFGEKAVASTQDCWKIPAAVPFDIASTMGLVYQTAYFALTDRAQMQPGEIVLVLGAGGGVGMACVQLAKAMGARVIAAVSRPARAALAREAGAEHVIDLSGPNLRDRLREEVSAATQGHMADIVLDPVGGDAFDAAVRAVAWRGRLVVIGFAAGRIPEIKANYLLLKNIALIGLAWSDYRARWPERVAEAQQELFALLQSSKLAPHIDRRLPLSRASEALSLIAKGEVLGKLVLVPEE